ncbi:MAG: CBS domain-containing protein [Gemmatimonadota bacterium]
MKVKDVMSRKVFSIRVDKKAFTARQIMDWAHIRHVPVVDRANRVVGVVSHRDVLEASVSSLTEHGPRVDADRPLMDAPIVALMHKPARTTVPDATVAEAARIMLDEHLGCLPVVEGDVLVGIVTEADLLRVLVECPNAR